LGVEQGDGQSARTGLETILDRFGYRWHGLGEPGGYAGRHAAPGPAGERTRNSARTLLGELQRTLRAALPPARAAYRHGSEAAVERAGVAILRVHAFVSLALRRRPRPRPARLVAERDEERCDVFAVPVDLRKCRAGAGGAEPRRC